MKYFLPLVFGLVIVGCTSSLTGGTPYNAIIPLESEEVGVFIPDGWKKVLPPANAGKVLLMAQRGSENIAISFEQSNEIVYGQALCKGAESGLANFTQTFVDNTQCFFSGHPTANTPLRKFWQKVVPTSESKNFLLMSCSAEQQSASVSQCPEILESFKILDKTE